MPTVIAHQPAISAATHVTFACGHCEIVTSPFRVPPVGADGDCANCDAGIPPGVDVECQHGIDGMPDPYCEHPERVGVAENRG